MMEKQFKQLATARRWAHMRKPTDISYYAWKRALNAYARYCRMTGNSFYGIPVQF